ncbi:MAG: hypothetical protein EB017_06445 [Betaproteobacteria bacterium]|nr:hypothetical protein [Betaproteobacteria bacterium]
MRFELFGSLIERLIIAADRRPSITADVARCIEASSLITLPLHHRQAHQGLRAGQIDKALSCLVTVVKRNLLHAKLIGVVHASITPIKRRLSVSLTVMPQCLP